MYVKNMLHLATDDDWLIIDDRWSRIVIFFLQEEHQTLEKKTSYFQYHIMPLHPKSHVINYALAYNL
jgi:hypothetical protein